MVTYTFSPRFEDAIREGWKTQTIRGPRAHHPRPGDLLQLLVVAGAEPARKICPDPRCTDVLKVIMAFDEDGLVERIETDGVPVRDLDAFAQRDGFADAADLSLFWRDTYGSRAMFQGVIIEWALPRPKGHDRAARPLEVEAA